MVGDTRARERIRISSRESDDLAKTILLYTPDIDFCASFRLLYQERYHIITTTDPKLLMPSIRVLQPDLLIADTHLTETMWQRFFQMKFSYPNLRIILLYVRLCNPDATLEHIPPYIDAAFHKPIDIAELSLKIGQLLHEQAVKPR